MNAVTPKPCCGFVLHFGYVEDGHISMMLINCLDAGFDTVEEGARDLAKYFLTDYLYGITSFNNSQEKRKRFQEQFQKEFVIHKIQPTLENFQQWLKEQSTATGDTWGCGYWTNQETWWPWDSMRRIYPYLGSFWESEDPAERVLLQFLNVEEDVPVEWAEFREELKQYQLELQKDRPYSFKSVVP